MSILAPLDTGLTMGLIMAFAVYGLAIAFRLFSFPDLTIEGSFLLGAAGFALAVKSGYSTAVAFPFAIILGAIAGTLTGAVHSLFRVNKFLAGIIVVSICYTLALRLMGASNIGLLQSSTIFDYLDQYATIQGVAAGKIGLLALLLSVIAIASIRALNSKPGLKMRVAGCNPNYARVLQINVPKSIILGLALTNSLAATSGALLAAHQGFADIGLSQGVLIFTLASMALGERLVSEKHFSVPVFIFVSSMLGSLCYQFLMAMAVRIGINPVDLKLITAIFVLTLVALRASKDDDIFSSI